MTCETCHDDNADKYENDENVWNVELYKHAENCNRIANNMTMIRNIDNAAHDDSNEHDDNADNAEHAETAEYENHADNDENDENDVNH